MVADVDTQKQGHIWVVNSNSCNISILDIQNLLYSEDMSNLVAPATFFLDFFFRVHRHVWISKPIP